MPKKKQALVPTRVPRPTPRFKNHAYLREDGSVDGEKLLQVVREMPGSLELMMLRAFIKGGHISDEYGAIADDLVSKLFTVILLAGYGVEKCKTQLIALKKLVQPDLYEVPQSKIREIAERYETSPHLARAWELRSIMSHLTFVVVPRRTDRPYTPDQPIKMRETVEPYWQNLADSIRRVWRPNSTLQSLAIRFYLERLEKEGVTGDHAAITERSLKRDLEIARKWEASASEDEKLMRGRATGGSLGGDQPITWYGFSQGWKTRAKKRPKATKRTDRKLLP